MNKETLKKNLREIPDFPKPGILFYDVTTLFKNAECLQGMIDELYELYKDKGITKVVGIESRGFILGGALAARLGAGFIMARKPGKLTGKTLRRGESVCQLRHRAERTERKKRFRKGRRGHYPFRTITREESPTKRGKLYAAFFAGNLSSKKAVFTLTRTLRHGRNRKDKQHQ